MRRYEVVFVLAPGLAEEEVDQQVEAFAGVAKELGAEVIEMNKWGKQRLAYPIEKHTDAYYNVLTLEAGDGAAVAELERRFRVTDNVIRFLTVLIDPELRRQAKREHHRERRIQRRAAAAAGKKTTEPVAAVEEEQE